MNQSTRSSRIRRRGTDEVRSNYPTASPAERILAAITVQIGQACWIWDHPESSGYGRITIAGKRRTAHRASYEIFVGEVPEGLVLDHLCRTKACVNPEHLEIVTDKVNILRSPISLAAKNSRKTYCPANHEYTELNTYVYKGRRNCRKCNSNRHLRVRVQS